VFCAGLLRGALDRAFDRLLGVSTRGLVITGNSILDGGSDNCPYEGSNWLALRRALKKIRVGPSDVFVDLGSGKGRALLVAGRLPYSRVIGIEIDDELSKHSQRNIDKARDRLRSREVINVRTDVLEWPIPDETSVLFMYNPFVGETFRTALHRVFDSYDRRPRALHIVYGYPWEHNWLMSTGRVVVDNVQPASWPALPRWWRTGFVIVTYRVIDAREEVVSKRSSRSLFRSGRAFRRWSGPNDHCFTLPKLDGTGTIRSY